MSGKNLKQRIRDVSLIFKIFRVDLRRKPEIDNEVPVSANRDEMKAIPTKNMHKDKDHYDFVMADSQHSAYNEPQLFCALSFLRGFRHQRG